MPGTCTAGTAVSLKMALQFVTFFLLQKIHLGFAKIFIVYEKLTFRQYM